MKEVLSLQSRQFQHHFSDHNYIVANTTLLVNVSFTSGKEKINEATTLVSCSDSQSLKTLKEKPK